MNSPELSIVIPTLNEEDALPLLLQDLVVQQEHLALEVIVSDGGSSDHTLAKASIFFATGQLFGRVVTGEAGRGRQLNKGVEFTTTEWLLFLHADSRFSSADQLKQAFDSIRQANLSNQTRNIAGRFSLSFDFNPGKSSFGYFFFEAKAALGFSGCIHGDQGMMLSKSFFEELGPFRVDLPVMEDTCFAEEVRKRGEWLLLPLQIITSARRFESEGLAARQTLNALMMNFLAVGWLDFFEKAPEVYRQQSNAKVLQLKPFYRLISDLFKSMSLVRRMALWLATGKYVRSQAWQLALWLDCKKAYRNLESTTSPGPWLRTYLRWVEPFLDNCLCDALTACLVRIWFASRLLVR